MNGYNQYLEQYSEDKSLDWIGVDWIGLDWIGLDWIGLDRMGFDWIGLDLIGLDRIGLDSIGLDWIGLDWAKNRKIIFIPIKGRPNKKLSSYRTISLLETYKKIEAKIIA